MATDFGMTATDAVTQAMNDLGVLGIGKEPKSAELEAGIFRLNAMLKSWQAEGVNLWREDDRTITITADTASVALDDDIRQVFGARLIGDYERILTQWEREDYLSLPVKDSSGDPTVFYVSRQRDNLTAYFWPVPTANSTVKLDCERIVNTIEDGSDTIDVPDAWNETVVAGLAARLAPLFGAGARAQDIKERAASLYARLLDDDRPQSVFIGPC
jgi:hypothetical protein